MGNVLTCVCNLFCFSIWWVLTNNEFFFLAISRLSFAQQFCRSLLSRFFRILYLFHYLPICTDVRRGSFYVPGLLLHNYFVEVILLSGDIVLHLEETVAPLKNLFFLRRMLIFLRWFFLLLNCFKIGVHVSVFPTLESPRLSYFDA